MESRLQEARNFIAKQTPVSNDDHIKTPEANNQESNNHFMNTIRTDAIQSQLTILASKVESLQIHCFANKCSTSSPSNENLNTNHESKRSLVFMCDVCDNEYTSKTDLKTHKSNMHLAKLSCKKCEYNTTSKEEFVGHKENEHRPTSHECGKCDFKTVHMNQLKNTRKPSI